jgi:hypothetical protein
MTVAKEEASAIGIVLSRMETHPEEFYGEGKKWAFIYKDYFRDIMTENEKAALHTKLKEIRREELTQRVLETITADEQKDETEEESEWRRAGGGGGGVFGSAPIKREGSKVKY